MTQNQVEAHTSAEHLERLRTQGQQMGWSLTDEYIFRDDGFSSARLHRPGLDRLRDRAKAGSWVECS